MPREPEPTGPEEPRAAARRSSWARSSRALLVLILVVAALAGACRLGGPRRSTPLVETAGRLTWSLAAVPGEDGLYQVAIRNPGGAAVSLAGLSLYLRAEVTTRDEFPTVSAALLLPGTVQPGEAVVLSVSLPTGPLWPGEFEIAVVVDDPTGGETLVVARTPVRPGGIDPVPVWPELGTVDFPVGDPLLVDFDVMVDPQSLQANLAFDPPVRFTLTAGPPDRPASFEIRPAEPLAPYTKYRLMIGPGLTTASGATAMGRPWAVVFATGPADPAQSEWAPAWAPDGTRVAWTARDSDGRICLYTGDLAGMTARVRLRGVAGGVPAWSGDGRRLYFALRERGGLAVGQLDLDTGQATTLIEAEDLDGCCGIRLAASPDGRYLAVEANLGAVDAHSDVCQEVYVYNFESGVLTRLPSEGLTSILAGWAGDRLLYASTYENFDHAHHFRYDLFSYEPGTAVRETLLPGGQLVNVGGFTIAGAAPVGGFWTWTPRNVGYRILHEAGALYVIPSLADPFIVPVALDPAEGRRWLMALSPDGTLIAAAVVLDDVSWDLILIELGLTNETAAVSQVTPVAVGPGSQFAPAWSPDGSRLAYLEADGRAVRVLVFTLVSGETAAFRVSGP